MNITPERVYVKITNPDLPESFRVSYTASPTVNNSDVKTIIKLNQLAKKRGLNATYELATKDEYWNYRDRK